MFDEFDQPPRDIVPRPSGPDSDTAELLRSMKGQPVEILWGGGGTESPDGRPIGVKAPERFVATLAVGQLHARA